MAEQLRLYAADIESARTHLSEAAESAGLTACWSVTVTGSHLVDAALSDVDAMSADLAWSLSTVATQSADRLASIDAGFEQLDADLSRAH